MGGSSSRFKNIRKENPKLQWTIIGDLGAGTYGKVHLAKNKKTNALAAAKVAALNGESQLDGFVTEINILVTCKHTNITSYMGGFYYDSTLWILIEVCTGGSLSDIIRRRKSGLDEPQIQCISHQVLRALEFLHANSVVHRDLNASNILLAEGGLIKIADFGVSAKCKGEVRRSSFIGTPNWMAPEVIACENNRSHSYGCSADVWSFGITLIELAETKAPHAELHPVKVLFKISSAPPPTLAAADRWSPMFVELLKSALVKDPKARPTAGKLLLHPFCRDQSTISSLVTLHRQAIELKAEKEAADKASKEAADKASS